MPAAPGSIEPIEVTTAGDLSLAIRGPADAPCVEVFRGESMAGGCGADLARPLDVGIGAVRDVAFLYGWTRAGADGVEVRLADGTRIEIDDLVAVDGYAPRFFLTELPAGGADLPIVATSRDAAGDVLDTFELAGP